ncbi:MAG: peptidylprolyl isomerase, partial [candidate division WOR-3 bacterium]|nr:peptidylprolyl isomerase [candidate division WOR-3 bacterium]
SKPKEIENVIFNLSKGQLTRVIKLNDTTYTILKVQDKRKAYTRPFNEVKEKIERKLRGQKEEEMNQQFIAALREKVKIEKFLTEEPPMLEEPEEPMPEPEEKE